MGLIPPWQMGEDLTLSYWLLFVQCVYVLVALCLSLYFLSSKAFELCFVFAQGILRRVDPWDTWRRDLTIIASFLLYGAWGAGVRFVVCCKRFP